VFGVLEGDPSMVQLGGQFLVGGAEGAADTAPLQEQPLDLADIGGGRFVYRVLTG
jgi:hypothetical protein